MAIIHCGRIPNRNSPQFCYLSATAERILRIFPQRNHSRDRCTQFMKHLIYIICILISIQAIGQVSAEKKKFQIDLFTYEKTSNDTIRSSIIEIFSGNKRIETAISDFDGISIFFLKSKDIIDEKIELKVYGPKCEIFENKTPEMCSQICDF